MDFDECLASGKEKLEIGDLQGSLQSLNLACSINPKSAVVYKLRGEIKRILGDFSGALQDMDISEGLSPNDAFTLFSRGEVKRMIGEFNGALKDLDKACELEPNRSFILSSRGATKRALRDFQGALIDLNKSNELEPDDHATLSSRGATKKDLGDYTGSLPDLNRAIELDPSDIFTLETRGELRGLLGDFWGALDDFKLVLEANPNNTRILALCGETKRMLGDFKGALKDLNQASQFSSQKISQRSKSNKNEGENIQDPFILSTRGAVKRSLGDFEGSFMDLDAADKLRPNHVFTLVHRALVKRQLKDYMGSLRDLEKAIELSPKDNEIIREWNEAKRLTDRNENLNKEVKLDVNQKKNSGLLKSVTPQLQAMKSNRATLSRTSSATNLKYKSFSSVEMRKSLESNNNNTKISTTSSRKASLSPQLSRSKPSLVKSPSLDFNEKYFLIYHTLSGRKLQDFDILEMVAHSTFISIFRVKFEQKTEKILPNNHFLLKAIFNWSETYEIPSTSPFYSPLVKTLEREYYISRKIPIHPNIIQIYTQFVDKTEKSPLYQNNNNNSSSSLYSYYIVTEYVSESLSSWYQRKKGVLTLNELTEILYQLAQGVKHLNDHFVVHRDLSIENVFIQTNANGFRVVIGDFRTAIFFPSSVPSPSVSTLIGEGVKKEGANSSDFTVPFYDGFTKGGDMRYMPLEISSANYRQLLNYKGYDIFSVGVISVKLATNIFFSERKQKFSNDTKESNALCFPNHLLPLESVTKNLLTSLENRISPSEAVQKLKMKTS